MEVLLKAIKYGVGIDMGKDEFHGCISAIDQTQRIKIKPTRAFKNTPIGFAEFYKWVSHHAKERALPIHYLMEATGPGRRCGLLRATSLISPSASGLCLRSITPEDGLLHQGIRHQKQE